MLRAQAFLALALAACGPRVDPRTPFDREDPRAAAEPAPTAVPSEPVAAAAPLRTGEIDRARLTAVLDQGPARMLGALEVAAETRDGRFVGWRLVRFLPGAGALTGLDLIPGDVLVTVNQRSLSKPDDLSALWTELYAADAIVAEVRRGDALLTLRFAITPAVASGASSSGSAAGRR